MLNINLVLETCVSISSCFVHEAYVWMKVVTFPNSCAYDASCRHEFEEDCFVSLESSQISHAHVRSILWSGDLQPSFHRCPEHTKPPIDLFKEKKFLLKSIPYARTSISSMMVPHLNSVVFNYKTTTWPCLSGTTCSHVCSRTSSCFGACYRSSLPKNLATSSRRFMLQPFFLDMLSLKYPITNRI